IENVTITDADVGDGWTNFTAEDENGKTTIIRDEENSLSIEEGYSYDTIAGISSRHFETVQVIPRGEEDFVADESTVQNVYARPGAGLIPSGAEVELNTHTTDADIYYTLDGSTPTKESNHYTEPIVVDEKTTLKAMAIKGESESAIKTFDYTVYDAEEGMQIHDIQGEGHVSPLQGAHVEKVEGIVTYKYDIRGSHYFHMQTPDDKKDGDPKTSEGIVIYTGKEEDVEIGDLINVSGDVSEYHIDGYDGKEDDDLPVTQINARDDRGGVIDVVEKEVALPAPIKITSSAIPGDIAPEDFKLEEASSLEPDKYSMDFWESIEGMRVEVAESTSTAPQMHGDLYVVTDDYDPDNRTVNNGIRLTEEGPDSRLISLKVQPNGPARDLKVKTGDKFTESLTGVVNYGFGNYKVYADLQDVEDAHEEVARYEPEPIVKDEEKLSVAAYNVENYSANSSGSETPDSKSRKIAEAFVDDMQSPDIIALIEVMANNGSESNSPEADRSYKRLINDIEAAGGPGYEFVNIDPEYNQDGGKPTGNIRVGYLYNPERVDFDDYGTDSDSIKTDAVTYEDGKLSTNPGRVSPDVYEGTRKPLAAQFEFNGESVVLLNNHLNSKLGDKPEYGQDRTETNVSRGQREKLAKEQNRFVQEIKADNPNENVVVLGDMNDFEFSGPVQTLKGDELHNLVEDVDSDKRYSYVYNGMSQVLDHALVSNNLKDKADLRMMKVNADFTDDHGRASDHDPVYVEIDFDKEVEEPEEPTEPEEFNLPIMHMNDTHAHVENYPYLNTLVKDYREENPESLLLHGGDVFSGTLYFNEFKGQADLRQLNLMGIDAMVFGNHEFDLGDSDEGHRALARFIRNANFPMLGTNSDFSEDNQLKDYDPSGSAVKDAKAGDAYNSIILESGGEEIGVFGLTTEDTENIASPVKVTFSNYIDTAKKEVEKLEDEGIDKIIAVTHLGHDSAPDVGNDLLLAENVDGIDVIVGGHSHTEVEPPVLVEEDGKAPTVVVQAGQYAENLGTVEVTFDDKGEVIDHQGELLAIEEDYEKVVEPDKKALE
ncbi:MAG: chitobiase/beta-hexosaminidase C-terminal domain-containing protein, partial [Staphylococcus equorum]|nr:chitobiase/beta-hexosaminidase C-terminal domain-containing protein [Staphylococcus equorum]